MLPTRHEIGAFEAKTNLSRLLDDVEKGACIVITRHGKPVAELRPATSTVKATFGCAKGKKFYMSPDFDAPLDDFKEYQ